MKSIRSLLGFKKKDTEVSAQTTLVELKETELMLTKKYEFIETQIEEQTQVARAHGLQNKAAAKRALKKRNMLQKNLEQLGGMLTNIQVQIDALSGFKMNKSVIDALSDGAVALRAANESIDLDKLHELMDNIGEQQDIGQDIVDAISQPTVGRSQDVDDDELNQELEALEQEELDKALLTITVIDRDDLKQKIKNVDNEANSIPSTSSNINKQIKTKTDQKLASMKSKSYEEEEEEKELDDLRAWSAS